MSYPARLNEGSSRLIHMMLLARSPERILALRLALSSAIGPSSVVLDAGCGSLGVLAIMAARLGARRVVAVDTGPLEVARELAEENGVADRIEFIQSDLALLDELQSGHSSNRLGHRSNLEYRCSGDRRSAAIADTERASIKRFARGGGHRNHSGNLAVSDPGLQDVVDAGSSPKAPGLGNRAKGDRQVIPASHGLKIARPRPSYAETCYSSRKLTSTSA